MSTSSDVTALSHSIEETLVLAGHWAVRYLKGHSVGLAGELGAGKTAFVRGMVAGLGGDPDDVHSPTFTLMNIYGTRPPFYHFDILRLNDVADLDGMGFFEFLESDGTKAVEWVDKMSEALAAVDFLVEIREVPEGGTDTRSFRLKRMRR